MCKNFVWIILFFEFSNKLSFVFSAYLHKMLKYMSQNLTDHQQVHMQI